MKPILRWLMAAHVSIYRLTRGKLLSQLGANAILLLDSKGRKTGVQRTTPLVYQRDGNNYIVVASAGGAPSHPAWYFNLKAHPRTTIQVVDQIIPVVAEEANVDEWARLWTALIARAPQFRDYQQKTNRTIPLMVLKPALA